MTAADVDGDGDLDVIGASLNDDEVGYFENIDGQMGIQVTAEETPLTFNAANSNLVWISDSDAAGLEMKVRLEITNGVISLNGTTNLVLDIGLGVNDAIVEFRGTVTDVNAALDGMIFTPTNDFNGSASIRILTDDQGNSGIGGALTDDDTINITVTPVNDAPVESAIEGINLAYTENDAATPITNTIAIADVDDANIESAVVQITGNYANGEDLLTFVDQNGISGVWNAGSGTLTLTGTATRANYETALRSITYTNTSDDPSALTRTVSFTVNDGDIDSNTLTRDIDVAPSNDAPVESTIEGSNVSYNENDSATQITNTFAIIDVDDGNIESAVVQITSNFANGEDVLAFNNQLGITGSWNAGTGILSLSGSATLADYETAIRSITYTNTSDDPSGLTRTVSFTVNDGDVDSNTLTRDIDVTPVNDDPVLTIPAGTTSYSEGAYQVIVPSTTLTDVDSPDFNGGQLTVNISSGGEATDDLYIFATSTILASGSNLSYDFGSGMVLIGSISGGNGAGDPLIVTFNAVATAAAIEDVVENVFFHNTSEDPAPTDRTITFDFTDGDSGASVQQSRTIEVTPSNDAPVESTIEGTNVAYTENDPATQITNTIAIGDVDDTNIESAVVQITGNYVNGQDVLAFTNTGTITGVWNAVAGTMTLTGSDTLANYEAALRSITFENTSNAPSELTRTVSFTVNDGDVDSNTLTRDIDVTSVNSTPVESTIEGTNIAFTENDGPTQITNTIAIADVDDTNIESAVVQITGNYVNGQDLLAFTDTGTITGVWNAVSGTMTLTGTDTLANYELALRSITFDSGDDPTSLTRTISFTVNDGNNDSNTLTRDVDITPVNDASVVTIDATTLAYASGAIDIDPTLTVIDVDNTMLVSAEVRLANGAIPSEDRLRFVDQLGITGSYNIGSGILTLTGTASVADYETALRSVQYEDIKASPTVGTLIVEFTVNDGTDISLVDSRTIEIIDDEPPRASDDSGTVAEGGAVLIDLAGNDSDNNNLLDLGSITIISGPANGSLVDNGDGTVTYTHDGSENFSDSFVYTIKDDLSLESNQATVSLTITPVNDAPQASNLNAAESYTEETALNLTDIVASDADDIDVTVTLTLSNVGAGTLNTGTSGVVTSTFAGGVWTASGAIVDVNTLLAGVTFTPTPDFAGNFTIATSVDDGEAAPVTGIKNFTAIPVNDAPVMISGVVNNLTVNEDSGFTSLGLGAVTYGPGGGSDEASQTWTYQVTVIPSASFGDIYLADGLTKVTTTTYTLAQLQGMQFKPADDATGGPSFFSWQVIDDGGTPNGGSDTLGQSIQLNITPFNDAPVESTIEGTNVSYNENDPATQITNTIAIADVDDTNIESAVVQITGNYANGEDLSGVHEHSARSPAVWNAATGTLTLDRQRYAGQLRSGTAHVSPIGTPVKILRG